MTDLMKQFIDLVFPPRCVTCSKFSQEMVCGECLGKIEYLKGDVCRLCGKPKDKYFRGDNCADCFTEKPPFEMARSVAVYDGIMKDAIHKFKFENKRGLAVIFGNMLVKFLGGSDIPAAELDCIVPVPLSKQREKSRGYNQSNLLAQEICKGMNMHMDNNILQKVKDIKPQFELSREERLVNTKGAFKSLDVQGKSILMIDDIYTTGSTVKEAAKALCAAGARRVFALTLARAVEP